MIGDEPNGSGLPSRRAFQAGGGFLAGVLGALTWSMSVSESLSDDRPDSRESLVNDDMALLADRRSLGCGGSGSIAGLVSQRLSLTGLAMIGSFARSERTGERGAPGAGERNASDE